MSRRRQQRRQQDAPEINITAFLNLMVVLIPFLLLTAAFNQLTILELYLPTNAAANEEQARDKRPDLEVTLRSQQLIIGDRKHGVYLKLAKQDDGYDYAAMQSKLLEIKTSYPLMTQVTLLSEPDISYDQIIQVMDRLRQTRINDNGKPFNVELFPDIAMGDAPARKKAKK